MGDNGVIGLGGGEVEPVQAGNVQALLGQAVGGEQVVPLPAPHGLDGGLSVSLAPLGGHGAVDHDRVGAELVGQGVHEGAEVVETVGEDEVVVGGVGDQIGGDPTVAVGVLGEVLDELGVDQGAVGVQAGAGEGNPRESGTDMDGHDLARYRRGGDGVDDFPQVGVGAFHQPVGAVNRS